MRPALVFSLVLVAFPTFAARRRAATPPPLFPPCLAVTGTPAVTFSRDGGLSVVPVEQKLEGVGYTMGVAALDATTLLSIHKQQLSISTDSGCSWRSAGAIAFNDYPSTITAAGSQRAYIWSDNREFLARYTPSGVTTLKPPTTIIGLGVDRASAAHLRAGGADGTLWESVDGGDSWSRLGSGVGSALVYRAAFDPVNLDHLLFGTAGNGAYVSFDGGRNYTRATGLGSGTNAFNIVISPADPNTVFAMGINLAESNANVPSHGKHIYLSRDGGRSFTPVVDEAPGVQIVNQPLMAAHPTDPNVVYFVFGTYFQQYGTDLFRYDAAAKSLTLAHYAYDDFDAIAFSPADPNVMYFGLEVVQQHAP